MSAMNGYAEPDEGQPAFFTEPQNQVLSALIAELQDTSALSRFCAPPSRR
jgi:hypothetical protein